MSKMNATRHAINSNSPVIAGLESEEDWETHRTGVLDSLDPEGSVELLLAERVALQFWRLNRVIRYERDVIETSQERVADDLSERLDQQRGRMLERARQEDDTVADLLRNARIEPARRASIEAEFRDTQSPTRVNRPDQLRTFLERERLLPDDAALAKIMRYESTLSRQLYQALHELEALQTRRRGGLAPLARLDVHGLSNESSGG